MNDMKDLLELVLDDEDPRDAAPVTAMGDLARGRRHVRRRRTSLAVAGAATLLVGALVPVALGGQSGSSPGSPAPAAGTRASIALVSYTGQQPRGYSVAWIPQGWTIQGGDLSYLVIAPPSKIVAQQAAGVKDTRTSERELAQRRGGQQSGAQKTAEQLAADPTYLDGKLAVFSASASEDHTSGTRISVNGRPGYLRTQEKTQILSYQSATGGWVDIQAPTLLGWDSAELAKFAAGVTVSQKAAAGGKG
jgi:hypothetical protein